jgi:hypothetical protein
MTRCFLNKIDISSDAVVCKISNIDLFTIILFCFS